MSLINIEKRITKNVVDFEKYISSDYSLVFADAEKVEEWAIELTVGDLYSPETGKEPQNMIYVDNEISISPQTSLILEVKEELRIPNNIYGIILPKGTLLLEHGIFMVSTKIESRYQGKLRILLYNTTKKKKYLKKNDVVGSCIFFKTNVTLCGQSLKNRPAPIRTEYSTKMKIVQFFKNEYKWIVPSILAIAALAVSIINILQK